VVEGVKRLYLDRLVLGAKIKQEPVSARAEELLLTQRIGEAVEHVYKTEPQRAATFAAKLDFYERWLKKLSLTDESLSLFPNRERLVSQSLFWSALAVLGTPVAVYGWAHRAVPHLVITWAVRRFAAPEKRKAQTSTTKILGGILLYTAFFGLCIAVFHTFLGWPASLWYALSLPPASLLAFYHLRELRKLRASLRNTIVLIRAPFAAKRLLALRMSLVSEIEAVHVQRRDFAAVKTV
jgi:hypothetical protein